MKSNSWFSCQAASLKRRSSARGRDHRLATAAGQALGGRLPELHVVVPEIDLGLDHLGRIAHHPRRHLEEGAADARRDRTCRRRASDASAFRLALHEFGDKPL